MPYLGTPCGWRSLSVGAIHALTYYAGITPVIFVSNKDADQARILFPEFEIVVLPGTQSMSLHNVSSWPRMISTWSRSKQGRFPKLDLVHSLEAYPTGLVGHWLATKLSVPHVVTLVGTYSIIWHTLKLDRYLYCNLLRRSSWLCPISQGTWNMVRRYFPDAISGVPAQVVLLGTDSHFKVPREVVLARPLPSIPTILSVGEVKKRKGYHVSLRAFAKVKSQLPSARYWIVGRISPGGYYRQLLEYIRDEDLMDVKFVGQVKEEELRHLYETASVFLLTPEQDSFNFEGFGLAFVEAGAYGLPVVATRTGGVSDAVIHGETGLLAESGEVNRVADMLISLLSDQEMNRRMGRANRKRAETLSWERYSSEQSNIYRRL